MQKTMDVLRKYIKKFSRKVNINYSIIILEFFYCKHCREACSTNLVKFNTKHDLKFIKTGFQTWFQKLEELCISFGFMKSMTASANVF